MNTLAQILPTPNEQQARQLLAHLSRVAVGEVPSLADEHAPLDRAAKARAAHMRLAAERAAVDPVRLARAVRIVQAGLALRILTPTDVLGTAE